MGAIIRSGPGQLAVLVIETSLQQFLENNFIWNQNRITFGVFFLRHAFHQSIFETEFSRCLSSVTSCRTAHLPKTTLQEAEQHSLNHGPSKATIGMWWFGDKVKEGRLRKKAEKAKLDKLVAQVFGDNLVSNYPAFYSTIMTAGTMFLKWR